MARIRSSDRSPCPSCAIARFTANFFARDTMPSINAPLAKFYGVEGISGEKIQIKASKAAKFSPASGLKTKLNG